MSNVGIFGFFGLAAGVTLMKSFKWRLLITLAGANVGLGKCSGQPQTIVYLLQGNYAAANSAFLVAESDSILLQMKTWQPKYINASKRKLEKQIERK